MSSTMASYSPVRETSSIFRSENSWVIPGSIAISYASVSSIPFAENTDAMYDSIVLYCLLISATGSICCACRFAVTGAGSLPISLIMNASLSVCAGSADMTSVLWPRSAIFMAVAHDVTVLPVPPFPVYITRRNATNWQDENKKGVEGKGDQDT